MNKLIYCFLFFATTSLLAQDPTPTAVAEPVVTAQAAETSSLAKTEAKTQEEKELETVNFNTLKKVLKNDKLEKEVEKKKEKVDLLQVERKEQQLNRYFFPVYEDFWNFLSELWLIKNVQDLKWDFEKPEYGLIETVANTFRNHGVIEKKIKILILNSSHLPHFALPANPGEAIFLISLPFIRSMDLTKQEIAILLLEDYVRMEQGYLMKQIETKELKEVLGKNYSGKDFNPKIIQTILDNLNQFIAKKGFSFQEQYELTKKMDTLLKSNQEHWNAYVQLLNKIDRLVKTNLIFENQLKLYPSPEMQIKWISPQGLKSND